MPQYKLFWGDSHTNLHLGGSLGRSGEGDLPHGEAGSNLVECLAKSAEHARKVLDFWPMAYYPYTYVWDKGLRAERWRAQDEVDTAWAAVCDLSEDRTSAGEFVVFPGYEWQGDGRCGDHNVFFYEGHPPIFRSRALPELYSEIRRLNVRAMAIPHHTAYLVGVRGKDWRVHDQDISPFAEIYSKHGCSESDEILRHDLPMLITTNLDMDEISRKYKEDVASRLYEMTGGNFPVLPAVDRRRQR